MASIVTRRRTGPKRLLPAGALPFRRRLLSWYGRHRRRLPWRGVRDPYAVLVSEIMLQQTQVARVLEFYPRFLARYPTLEDLAAPPAAAARGRAADWNQALMDLGATYCTARRPRCQDCPVRDRCATGRTRTDQDGRLSPSSEAATRRPRR